ncbi:MAG: BamA/TamA family outer membrane protein [Chroococcidiopsidaceae cyanobacterium CP_BM_RX_35]|nr:BamA/TamA family outer membrane protein [Chroococcidiopsidaceae cyanobacterium CP_BM_RX_35]
MAVLTVANACGCTTLIQTPAAADVALRQLPQGFGGDSSGTVDKGTREPRPNHTDALRVDRIDPNVLLNSRVQAQSPHSVASLGLSLPTFGVGSLRQNSLAATSPPALTIGSLKQGATPGLLEAQANTIPAPAPPNQLPNPNQPNTPSKPKQPVNPSGGVQTPTTPNPAAPNPEEPNPAKPNPTVPVIPPPGTGSQPQQQTPNQLPIPITPSPSQRPTINNNLPPTPPPTTTPGNAQPSQAPPTPEPQVLVAEVAITNAQGQPLPLDLQNQVYGAISTQPGRTTTRAQLQSDINAIFATGYFSDVRAVPSDTPLGVRVTFIAQPNPILRNVQVQANTGTGIPSVLPPRVITDIFSPQYGTILNLGRFGEGVKQLNKWYKDHGYVLAQVIGAPQVSPDGTVNLQVAEGVIEGIQVNFRNKSGEDTNANGTPYTPHTRRFIVTRELESKPNTIFNRATIQKDIQRVYGLGIFQDVQVALNPGQDPRKVDVVLNVNEKGNGSIAVGAGIGSASGLFGTLSYQQQNLGGNNQTIGADLEVGTSRADLAADLRFTDPWIAGDPYHTSYTVEAFRRQAISLVFDNGNPDVFLPNGDRPRVVRLGGGVSFTRPLSKHPLQPSEWTASAGFQYQRVSIEDSNGNISKRDSQGNLLSFSRAGQDDLFTFQLGAVRDRRNDLIEPTSGSLFRIGDEQSVPIGLGNILLNRVRGSYSQYFPVKLINFSKGPQTLAFNIQSGTIIGDLPPYEAFAIGGTDSVRGYREGGLASARSFVQGTVEYRFPLFSIIGGALFFDAATDLGTDSLVPGKPAVIRGKPGSGFGYGIGVRVRSPLGPIRIDYGINDRGSSRIEFGIGERF